MAAEPVKQCRVGNNQRSSVKDVNRRYSVLADFRPTSEDNDLELVALVQDVKIRLSENSSSLVSHASESVKFEGGALSVVSRNTRNTISKNISLGRGEVSLVSLPQGTGLLFTGTELTSCSPYEVLLISSSGKHKAVGSQLTVELEPRPLAMKGKMVIPTAIELELPKDFDVASYARFVHDVCSGRAVEWPALSPWWEVPSPHDLHREIETLKRTVAKLQERNKMLEGKVGKFQKKFELYDKFLAKNVGHQ